MRDLVLLPGMTVAENESKHGRPSFEGVKLKVREVLDTDENCQFVTIFVSDGCEEKVGKYRK